MAYLKKISTIGKLIFPSLLWDFPKEEDSIYLTFDDGPIPEITLWVLKTLSNYNAKATFFCIGENVEKHPAVFQEILKNGHSIGNHTFHHVNGWKTSTENYLENFRKAEEVIQKEIQNSKFRIQKKLFRPPYGKIKPSQIRELQKLDYKIVMWQVISGDFDASVSIEACYKNVVKNFTSGGIVVFHDSIKAEKNLKATLPGILKYYTDKGFRFKAV